MAVLLTMEEKDGQKEWIMMREEKRCWLWSTTLNTDFLLDFEINCLSVSSWRWWIELNECIEHDYYMMVRWCLVSFSRCSLCFRLMLWIHEEVEDWGKCPLSVSPSLSFSFKRKYCKSTLHSFTCLLMSLHMKCQVIWSGETSLTMRTLEGLGSRVFPKMTSQFIRSSESPLTSFPWALVWLFSCSYCYCCWNESN